MKRHSTVTPKQEKILKQLCQYIDKHESRFDMESFIQLATQGKKVNICKTTLCAAGTICLQAGFSAKFIDLIDTDGEWLQAAHETNTPLSMIEPYLKVILDGKRNYSDEVALLAAAIGGFTDKQAGTLFYSTQWPEPFQKRFYQWDDEEFQPSAKDKASIAIERFNHFITTGK